MGTVFIRLLYFLLPYLVKNSKRFMSDGRTHHTVSDKLRKAYFIIVALLLVVVMGFGYGGYRYYILFKSQRVLEESVADLRRNQPDSKLASSIVEQNQKLLQNITDLITLNNDLQSQNSKLLSENRTLKWKLGVDDEGKPVNSKK